MEVHTGKPHMCNRIYPYIVQLYITLRHDRSRDCLYLNVEPSVEMNHSAVLTGTCDFQSSELLKEVM